MRRHAGWCGCLFAVTAAWLAVTPGCRSSSHETGTLTGTVKDAITRVPIDGAEVTIGAAVAYSDEKGKFTMEALSTGERDATVTAAGYRTLEEKVTIDAGDNTVVFELHPSSGATDGGQRDGPQSDAGQQDGPATCSGNSCTYGYAYSQCCYEAQYCTGAASLACRSTCGSVGERCGASSDCCNNNCVSGYCATLSCAGTACTYGSEYSGCCGSAPYCTNYYGASYKVCRATCGATNELCYSNGDCCSYNCVSGYCAAPSCAGNTCTYGSEYSGCCGSAPYCTNYYGASYKVCRTTCGGTNELCYSNGDCCSYNCVSGYCAPPCVAAGQLCSAGYAHGGCCASAPYCIHYYSQPTICQTTCGAASQHCQANSDCCTGLNCVYNAGAGYNICTAP